MAGFDMPWHNGPYNHIYSIYLSRKMIDMEETSGTSPEEHS